MDNQRLARALMMPEGSDPSYGQAYAQQTAAMPKQRGSVLPFTEYANGDARFDPDAGWLGSVNRLTRGQGPFWEAGNAAQQGDYTQAGYDMFEPAGVAMTGGIAVPKPSNSVGMFGGKLAAENLAKTGETRPLRMLQMLDEMEAAGIPREQIWAETAKIGEGSPYTGAMRGVDKHGKFEIDDSGLKVGGRDGNMSAGIGINNPAFAVYHPELAKAYPKESADITSIVQPGERKGSWDHDLFNLEAYGRSAPERRTVAAHELDHFSQGVEGFGKGGNPRMFAEPPPVTRATLGAPRPPTPQEIYHRLGGEVSSRTVEKRLDLTPDQRRARAPWLDYDVPEADQIVRYGGSSPQMSLPEQTLAKALMNPETQR